MNEQGHECFPVAKLGAEHAPEVAGLERQCFSQPWNAEQYAAALAQSAFAAYGLRESGGALAAYVTLYHTGDAMEILNIAVRPDRRRQGLGRRLLRHVLRLQAETCIVNCVLEVRPGNLAARTLYEKTGFAQVGLRRGYYSDTGEDALVYALDLAGKNNL